MERETIALEILKAILSGRYEYIPKPGEDYSEAVARHSFQYADAFITESKKLPAVKPPVMKTYEKTNNAMPGENKLW